MIRFLDLKGQICEGSNDFAFYDTISDTILSFGSQQDQIFDSIDDFACSFNDSRMGTTYQISRFLTLIPDNYFSNT